MSGRYLPIVLRSDAAHAPPDLSAAADALLDDAQLLGIFLTLDPNTGHVGRLEMIDAPDSRDVSVGMGKILTRIRYGSPRFRAAVAAAITRRNTARVGDFFLDPSAIDQLVSRAEESA